ncbi:MAG: ABC transporter permease [Chlamydiae bacterium]|nr:ABC transporter permease [Chlamydiota bacterium]
MLFRIIIKKLAILLISLFFVVSLTFFLFKLVPGDPFAQEQAVPEEILHSMHHHYGLDRPWYVQYALYLKGIITWDLGPSFKYEGRTVNAIIKEGASISLVLGAEALLIALIAGIFLGTLSAVKRGSFIDRLCMIGAVVGISVPNFILATFLQYIFSMKWGLFPVARWGSFAQSVLPAVALAMLPTAFIARLLRASMVEVLLQDYIVTAKVKGLSFMRIWACHVFKNSILTVMTYLAPLCSSILTGSFVVERIFGIPGLGSWFVTSILNRDYTVIMGLTLFYSGILMASVFLVDVLYTILDPRIKLSKVAYA